MVQDGPSHVLRGHRNIIETCLSPPVTYFTDRSKTVPRWYFFCDSLAVPWGCLRFVIVVFPVQTHLLFFTFVMHLRLFIAALWSPAGKGLTSGLLFAMFNCVFLTFPCGILGQMWYLNVSIPDLCRLYYFL